MAAATLWETLADVLDPSLWFALGFLGTRLAIVLLRRLRLVSGLQIVGYLLPLCVAVSLAIWRTPWYGSWVGLVNFLKTAIVVLVAMVFLHIADQLLMRRLENEGRPNAVPRLMRDIARGALLVLTTFIAVSQIFKTPIGTVLVSSTVFTAIVGFALQDLLKNVFAGIALQIERPFAPGDWVFVDRELGFGRVLEMSWRAIRVRPRDGQIVVIPNSIVAAQQITNLSATGRPIAMRLKVNVDASHPPNRVHALLKQAVLSVDGVLEQPAPFVFTRDFTAATALYEIKFWVANYENYPEQQGHAMARIWYVLHRAEVRFAPNEMVMTRPPAGLQRSNTLTPEQIVARLRRIIILDVLTEDELYELAEQIELRLWAEGECLAHQGEYEDTLYAITSGAVRVEVCQEPGDDPLTLTTLGPGEVFGERGMLLGEPRSASVIACKDTRTLVIERADLLPFFERHPELPERLATILTARQSATSASLQEAQRALARNANAAGASTTRSVAEKIRRVLLDLTG